MKRVFPTLILVGALGTIAAHAAPAPITDEQRLKNTERRMDTDRRRIDRIEVARDADVDRFRHRFEHRRGWRTYGVFYGLPAGVSATPELSFLSDDGLLVGSYDAWGQTVYVYAYSLGGTQHQVEVASNGRILSDELMPPARY